MALSEEAALETALEFLHTKRRELVHPVHGTPSRKSLPRVAEQGQFAGHQVWSFDFDYIPPANVLVDPACVRILVDDASGEAVFFTPW
ncbi:MAG: hypothetical protein IT579_19975 [Verrucomicrobia subdivision 3 bacterium]|nr:hypothetical protein [Limisphaerales bacterium]